MKKLLYVLPMAALLTIASCSQGSEDKSESKEPESASSITDIRDRFRIL